MNSNGSASGIPDGIELLSCSAIAVKVRATLARLLRGGARPVGISPYLPTSPQTAPASPLRILTSRARTAPGQLNKDPRTSKYAQKHKKEYKPFGISETLAEGPGFRVLQLTIKPGAATSLQMHYHRAMHQVVVEGTAY